MLLFGCMFGPMAIDIMAGTTQETKLSQPSNPIKQLFDFSILNTAATNDKVSKHLY